MSSDYFDSPDSYDYGDRYNDRDDWENYGEPFADPGGVSALRAGRLAYPCPTCKQPDRLSAADVRHGYQCDACADRMERGGDY